MTEHTNVTERQAKYFASLRASLESTTGKSLSEWIEIARSCPETKHRARLRWFKETHSLLQNRASLVIDEAFGAAAPWSEAITLIEKLWTEPASRGIYESLDALAMTAPGAVRTARKGYTAWSRTFQFAAAKPLTGGAVRLGLAVQPSADATLEPPKNENWSERLKSRMTLATPEAADSRVAALLQAAWAKA